MLTISMLAVMFCCTSLTPGKDCIGDQSLEIISVGLMDGVKATLKADLNVSKLNHVLFTYIKKEVTKSVEVTLDTKMGKAVKQIEDKVNRFMKTKVGKLQGYIAGPTRTAKGSGSNYLCLSSNPESKSFSANWNQIPGHLYGIGWELTKGTTCIKGSTFARLVWSSCDGSCDGTQSSLVYTGNDRSRSSNQVDDKDVPRAVCLTKG
ncbi:unnamed protein product [Mytilus coruscus]|uniref:Uncharacterized protein n=1 Tax=Mytilus coruscus TaxID=42192 RepID=A0A6J8E7Z2_MYTCO|nr:unnamed protein product [Mytilus coruscus]